MKTLGCRLGVVLLVVTASRFPAFAGGVSPFAAEIDALVDRYVAEEDFAGSVLVAKDGEIDQETLNYIVSPNPPA